MSLPLVAALRARALVVVRCAYCTPGASFTQNNATVCYNLKARRTSPVWAGAHGLAGIPFPPPFFRTDRRDARYARGCQRPLHLYFHPDHSQEGPGQPFGRAPRGRAPLQLSSWPRATARTPAAGVPTYTPTPRQVSASHPPLETKGPTYARTRAPYSHPHQGSLLTPRPGVPTYTPSRGRYLHASASKRVTDSVRRVSLERTWVGLGLGLGLG